MPDEQINEPRSAVEAAGSEGHGGYTSDPSKQKAQQYGQYASNFGQQNASDLMGSQSGSFFNKQAQSGPQTIVSAISRLRKLAQTAQPLLHQGAQFVQTLEGPRPVSGSAAGNDQQSVGQPQNPGTADQLHSAIADVETLLFGFGDLIARAKAAHG